MSDQLQAKCVTGKNAKYEQLAQTIAQQIRTRHYLPGDPLPSIRRLMADTQLSMTTVVNALNLLESQGVLTRRLNRGYFVARSLEDASPSALIAFVTPALLANTNLYNAGLTRVYGVGSQYALSTFSANADLEQFQQLITSVLRLNPAGMILNSLSADICQLDGQLLSQSEIPMVVIGPAVGGLVCDRVEESMASGALHVMNHLHERGLDQNVAVLRMVPMHDNHPAGCSGHLIEHLQHAGLDVDSNLVFDFSPSHGYGPEPDPFVDAKACVAELIAKGTRFRTLICGHDYPAMGAIAAFTEAGLRVPEDVAVISCMRCNTPINGIPKVTTVDYGRDLIGQLAATLLARRIDGSRDEPMVHCMGGNLCVGQTT